MSEDELDDYERILDHDEALVIELLDEQELSDGDELVDIAADPDSTPFDDTRHVYTGNGDGDEVDLQELGSVGALLDDPERDDERDDTGD